MTQEVPAPAGPHPQPPPSPPIGHPLFAPPAARWERLSSRFVTVRRITATLATLTFFVPAIVAAGLLSGRWWVAALVALVGFAWWIWRWNRANRWVASWGWAERDADLCVTQGLWAKQLLVVPFGRMQMVKVTSGPLLRAFGLATVQLVTASPQTDATIPGLPLGDALALRDRLIELSDARGSGL